MQLMCYIVSKLTPTSHKSIVVNTVSSLGRIAKIERDVAYFE